MTAQAFLEETCCFGYCHLHQTTVEICRERAPSQEVQALAKHHKMLKFKGLQLKLHRFKNLHFWGQCRAAFRT